MSKPREYRHEQAYDLPFEGSPGILKKKKEKIPYEPEEFLPKLKSPKTEIENKPMP